MDIVLQTERLILRRFTPDDVDLVYELDSDPEVMRFITGGQPTPRDLIRDQVLPRWLALYDQGAGCGFWAAQRKADGGFLGWFHWRPIAEQPGAFELGYRLVQAAWGRGYATEGSRALLRKGFTELGAQRAIAHTLLNNTRSQRVMEKVGLKRVREFRYSAPGAWHDQLVAVEYGIDAAEWKAAQKLAE